MQRGLKVFESLFFFFFTEYRKTPVWVTQNLSRFFSLLFTNLLKPFVKMMTKRNRFSVTQIGLFIWLKKNSNKDSKTFNQTTPDVAFCLFLITLVSKRF